VAIAPSTWRPPWLETTIPSIPAATARRIASIRTAPIRADPSRTDVNPDRTIPIA